MRQTLEPLEILVVDDCSSDDTRSVVERMAEKDPRIRLIQLDRNLGGAAARNAGITAARGGLLAFLDSDDEWTEGHLARKIGLLRDTRAGLVFGSFHVHDGRRQVELRCQSLQGDPLEYLFLGRGGFRTSTFVCEKASMKEIMFDDAQFKHQDWDLVINFLQRFPVATDTRATAILHVGGPDRLSAQPNHEATHRFLRKNWRHCSRNGWLLFATIMLERTFRAERKGQNYLRYLALINDLDPAAHAPIRFLASLMRIPRIGGRLFRAACRRYCVATARRRLDVLQPGPAR
jgi:glycosyltransferase involved in cell wall biosynthesis